MKTKLSYGLAKTRRGPILVALNGKGIAALAFLDRSSLDEALNDFRSRLRHAEFVHDPRSIARMIKKLESYWNGKFEWMNGEPLDLRGTPFQLAVWKALKKIPPGQTRSYSQLAKMVGRPSAVRAVAGAVAANPVALLVPCHRIVRKNGEIGGFRWGTAVKAKLLDHERRFVSG